MKRFYLSLLIIAFGAAVQSNAQSCLSGWQYATPVTLTNPNASNLVNYQVKLTVNTAALVSSGHMQASGSDIRFYQGSCCNILPHYVESGMNTATTVIWVKVGNIPASGSAIVNMAYGNASASNISSATAVFDLWEPFDNTINHFVPTGCGSGSYNMVGGYAAMTWSANYMVASDVVFSKDTVYTVDANVSSASGNWPGLNWSKIAPDYKGYSMLLSGTSPRMGEAGSSASDFCRGENWASAIYTASSVAGIWSVTWISTGNIIGEFPTVGAMSSTSTTHNRDMDMRVCFGGISSGSGTMSIDWIRVRKYAASEPTIALGTEQNLSFQTVSLGANQTVCPGNNVNLDAGAGFTSYSWSTGSTNQSISVSAPGMYIVTAVDASFCPSSDTVTISNFTPGAFNLGSDQTVCPGVNTPLDAGSGFNSYSWSTGATTQTISVNAPGTYIINGTDANGCTAIADTLAVFNFTPGEFDAGADQTVCPGESATFDAGSGFTMYLWSDGTSTQTINVSNPGSYTINGTDANGCDAITDTVVLANFPAVTASFTSLSAALQASFTSTSTNGNTYAWDFGDGNTSTQQNPVHTYSASGTYNVCLAVTSSDGCVDSTCINVTVANTGISSQDNPLGVQLYPNPADETAVLSISTNEAATYTLLDMTGKKQSAGMLKNGNNLLDVSALAPGVYLVKVEAGTHQFVQRLVVK